MKHFQVRVSSEPEVIGVNNGVYQIEIDKKSVIKSEELVQFEDFFNYSNKNIWNNQKMINQLNPPLIKAKKLKKAKVTDIMGYAPEYSFLNNVYSEKFAKIIQLFDIPDLKLFDLEIEGVPQIYHFIFFEKILLSEINYEKSSIYTGYKVLNDVVHHQIKNYGDFLAFKTKKPIFKFEKISISENYRNKDIISIQGAGGNFYSERLIDTLLDSGITGMEVYYNNSIELDFYK